MPVELIVIGLAFFALTIDVATSRLSVPRLRIAGRRSEPYEGEDVEQTTPLQSSGDPEEISGEAQLRVFQFAVQSDEDGPLEWESQPVRIRMQVRGAGRFERPFVRAYVGPDVELRTIWSKDCRTCVLEVPRIRPHKTWIFRCFVTPDTEEMLFLLEIPTKWPVRRFLKEVNASLFSYGVPPYDAKRLIIRSREDRRMTRGFRTRRPANLFRLALLASMATLIYWGAVSRGMKHFGVEGSPGAGEVLAAGTVLLLGLVVLDSMSQRPSLPIAQGYQTARPLPPEPPVGTDEHEPQLDQ